MRPRVYCSRACRISPCHIFPYLYLSLWQPFCYSPLYMTINTIIHTLTLFAAVLASLTCVAQSRADDDNHVSDKAAYGLPGNAVDLGLSVLWSDQNVGATGPTDVGRFFGYGDLTGTVMTCSYNDYISQDIVGTDRDPAYVFWGSGWRMPTASEIEELVERCQWKWVVRNGTPGFIVKGRESSIFLPVTGQRSGRELAYQQTRGYYWSGEISETDHDYAGALFFHKGGHMLKNYRKFYGFVIRPVKEEF